MKCKVMYFKENDREWTDKHGFVHTEASILLLQETKDGNGYLPLGTRTFTYTGNDGKPRTAVESRIQLDNSLFKTYRPKIGEDVEVTYNQYGRIDSIKRIG